MREHFHKVGSCSPGHALPAFGIRNKIYRFSQSQSEGMYAAANTGCLCAGWGHKVVRHNIPALSFCWWGRLSPPAKWQWWELTQLFVLVQIAELSNLFIYGARD
jgi:hypothetical protein